MNADPDEGQPTTVPEATTAETVPPETPALEAEEAEAGESEAAEPEAEAGEAVTAEADAEDAEPEAEAAEADPEPEAAAAEPDTAEAEGVAAAAEPEVTAAEDTAPQATAPKSTTPETPAPAGTPLVANRYRLVAEIGGGAMGVVWRARDEVLGRDVAVKELRPDHGMSGAQVRTSHQRARREGRIAARLQHPNAVVIYDVAEHDGRPYLIMEYVPSQSLGDILSTGTVLTPTEVTSIGAQLASALTAAHEAGIVHRDIKPGNVLMTSDGTVKLTDFGISRAAGDATVTATGEILGTPAYTAPEVAQGHPVAFPADVFSLGATLYAAVEGTPPFGEDVNAMATLLRVVRNEIRRPKRSGPLTDTIMWMLSPEPADRPTMKQVWQGLDAQAGKSLRVAGIKPPAPETKPFAAPSPTLVVPDAVVPDPVVPDAVVAPDPVAPDPIAKRPAAKPERTPKPARRPKATPAPTPTPTPSSSTSPVSTPALTPTTAMEAASTPTRNTQAATPSAAKSPATPPPVTPASDRPIATAAARPPARRPRSRMPLAITVCVVGTAVLIVAIVVAMNAGKHSSSNQPVAHGSTTSAPSSPARSASTSQPSTTPSSTPSTSASSASTSPSSTPSTKPTTPSTSTADVATQMTTFLTSYYSLLPGNLSAAWPNMTAAYQTNVAQGFSGYQDFWGRIQQVTLTNVVATPPSTVTAMIHYSMKDGSHSDELTTFGLVKEGNAWKINTSHT